MRYNIVERRKGGEVLILLRSELGTLNVLNMLLIAFYNVLEVYLRWLG